MASNYSYDKNSPFFSTSDSIDDATFLRASGGGRVQQASTPEQRYQQLMEERQQIEQRTIESSFRSMKLLHESEKIGVATAEELGLQREQLQNTEQKLDEINTTLRVSARHIQGIKSVFGSIKNYFSGKNDEKRLSTSTSEEFPRKTSESSRNQLTEILNSSQALASTNEPKLDVPKGTGNLDSILDKNLEDIGDSISRLKSLGLDLNKEIVEQNEMIDRITDKAEDVDARIAVQNRDMNRILKK